MTLKYKLLFTIIPFILTLFATPFTIGQNSVPANGKQETILTINANVQEYKAVANLYATKLINGTTA